MEIATQQMQDWRDLSKSAFDDLISSGGNLDQVLSNITDRLIDMVYQASILGEGPLSGLFGTRGGGLIDSFVSALVPGADIPAKAGGGMIYGPGSGTSDDVLMFGSSGEYVVNAAATRRNRRILELINAGADIPAFASGGMIGGGPRSGPAALGGVSINIENRSSTPVTGEVEELPGEGGGRKFAFVLSDQVGAALQTPGGGARRALSKTYGVRQRGTKR